MEQSGVSERERKIFQKVLIKKCSHKNTKFLTAVLVGFLFILVGLYFFSCTDERKVRIGIQPYGDFSNALTDTIASTLEGTYGITAYKLPTKPIPEQAFTKIKTPRYIADKIITIIKKEKPYTLQYVLAQNRLSRLVQM